jgi:phosphoserine phosphatase
MPQSFPYVLNVVSAEADALAGPLRAAAAEFGTAGEIVWLAPERAFDIPFLGRPSEVLAAARATAAGMNADINVVPAEQRRKKLLIADMESTIIDCECLDELADLAGLKDKIAPITKRTMRGEIDFEQALRERVAMLKGLPVAALEQVYEQRVHLNPGAREVVASMRAYGALTLLVSGGFSFFAERVAKGCGFDRWQANRLVIEGGKLTGEVADPILDRDAKLRALEAAVAELNIDFADTIAVGDGANDVAMIERAGLGVGYYPKPILAKAADAVIAHSDLTTLLYLQGYSKKEISTARPLQ